MHLPVPRALLVLSLLPLSTYSLPHDSAAGQIVLGNGQEPDFHYSEDVDYMRDFGTQHPIPPDRNPNTDPWGLSSFENTTFHNNYHPLYEIDAFMEHLVALHPARVSLYELGHSAQGREMLAMRVSSGPRRKGLKQGSKEKRGFVITGAQHAREWIASASALYIAHALTASSSDEGSLAHLLDEFDFHIIPVPNPDGYVYTWESDRFWYKNRMPVGPNEPCQGLDLNRNWGAHWSPAEFPDDFLVDSTKKNKNKKDKHKSPTNPGQSPGPADPCSHWYPGHRPFEAPEVNNIANYITRQPALEGFLDLRSYGQMVSWPYSYSCDLLPRDAEDLFEAALGMVHTVKKRLGTVYTTGNLCNMLYPAPGNILDWMYSEAGIRFAYAAHLRDTGTYGYALPREWIRPVGEEVATMIDYLAGFIAMPHKT